MRSREEIEKRITELFEADEQFWEMFSDGKMSQDEMVAKRYANRKVRKALKWVLEEK